MLARVPQLPASSSWILDYHAAGRSFFDEAYRGRAQPDHDRSHVDVGGYERSFDHNVGRRKEILQSS